MFGKSIEVKPADKKDVKLTDMDKGQVSLDDVLIEMVEDDVEMMSPKEKKEN